MGVIGLYCEAYAFAVVENRFSLGCKIIYRYCDILLFDK